jgi:hypothetical protein
VDQQLDGLAPHLRVGLIDQDLETVIDGADRSDENVAQPRCQKPREIQLIHVRATPNLR